MIVKRRSGFPCTRDTWVEGDGFTLRQRGAGRAFLLVYERAGQRVLLSCEIVVDGVDVDLGTMKDQRLPPESTFESVAAEVGDGLAVLWRGRRYELNDWSQEGESRTLASLADVWDLIGWDKSYEEAWDALSRRIREGASVDRQDLRRGE
jgi:hypothetical protein